MQGIRYLLCGLLLATPLARGGAPEDAQALARDFYAWVLEHPSAGIPRAGELEQLRSLLSPALLAALQDAARAEDACALSAAPGDKPLMVEGDLFVGSYEGASEVALAAAVVEGDQAVVPANLIHLDPRFEKAHPHRVFVWQDRLQLAHTTGRWQVVDVHPGTGDSLQATLASFIALAERECRMPR